MKNNLFLASVVALLVLNITAKPNSRISGGIVAPEGQFPFAAAIQVQTTYNRFFCGGALIRDRWILTSGHCVYNATLFTIQLGSANLSNPNPNRITVLSTEYFVYPDFDPLRFQHDIALIKLRSVVTQYDSIQDIGMLINWLKNSRIVLALGWGQTSYTETEPSESLHYVQLVTMFNEDCQSIYGDEISSSLVCVAGNPKEGTCIGDTGSPLISYSADHYVVVGVASFVSTNGCGSNDPSGFTRISIHYDWINRTATSD